jgi:outer membrane receptor for ferrienterochelin and colicins
MSAAIHSCHPPRLHLLAAAICAFAGSLAAVPAMAEQSVAGAVDSTAKDAQAQPVQQVQVQGALDAYDPRRDDTAAKIVVNHDEIVRFGDTSVLDVLKRVPGVTVSGNGGRGGEVRMRGLGGGYTQVLINGERAPAGFSIDSLAPDVIERIEVLRAASAEFSTQSIAGTINIVLKKTVKAGQRELKLGYAVGNGVPGPNANLQLSDKAGPLAWSFALNVIHQRVDRTLGEIEDHVDTAGRLDRLRIGRIPESGHGTAVNLTPRVVWTFSNGDTLVSQTFANLNRVAIVSRILIDTPLGPLPAYPSVEQGRAVDNRTLREELSWSHKFPSDAKLSLNYSAPDDETRRFGNLDGEAVNPASPPLRELIHSIDHDRGVSSMGKFTSAAWDGHTLAFGWDGGYTKREDARLDRDALQADAAISGADQFYTAHVARLALYGQDEWNVTPRWSVYLGARWEGIGSRVDGNDFAAARNRSTVWSPLLQTLYKLPDTKGDQLRLALTRTYRAPDLQSLIPHRVTEINNNQTSPDSIGNPDLKPELALGLDVAWEHYWAEGALVSVGASARNIDNNTREQTGFDGSRWISRPQNTGHARARGLELETKFPLKALIDTATALDLRASLSRNWSSVEGIPGPDNRLLGQTPLSAQLGMDYKQGAFSTGGSFVFSKGGNVRVSANQTTYESVRRALDLYALWKFDAKRQLRMSASNLFGQDRIVQGAYTVPGDGTQRDRMIYPGHPTLRATLEVKF